MDVILSRITSIFYIDSITLSGGEPLLNPSFSSFIRVIKEYSENILIITNGTRISDTNLKEIPTKNCFFHVSIHGATVETHDSITGIKGSFHNTINGIITLKKLGYNVAIVYIMADDNKNELKEALEFAFILNIKYLIVNELRFPINQVQYYYKEEINKRKHDFIKAISENNKLARKFGVKLIIPTYFPVFLLQKLNLTNSYFTYQKNKTKNSRKITISHNGMIRRCQMSNMEYGSIFDCKWEQFIRQAYYDKSNICPCTTEKKTLESPSLKIE